MGGKLSYLLVSPSCVRKGRFAPVLARLLSRATSDLVAIQSIPFSSPSAAAAARWLGGTPPNGVAPADWERWVARSLSPVPGTADRLGCTGILLAFHGPDAVDESVQMLGGFSGNTVDESIRGTFGDLEVGSDGGIRHCEPAAFGPGEGASVAADFRRFAEMAAASSALPVPAHGCERTLVLVKPDNFRHGGGRPGQVADLFCRTGLSLVGARLLRFSVRLAVDFYGPVRDALRTRLDGVAGEIAAHELAPGGLGIAFDAELTRELGRLLGPVYGEQRFQNLVKFMAGHTLDAVNANAWDEAGTETTLALVFEGPDAIARIRAVLGPTDPLKAPRGTVRREFGRSLLENGGHASDSVENAAREIALVRPWDFDLDGILGRPA